MFTAWGAIPRRVLVTIRSPINRNGMIMFDGFTHLELIEISLNQAENNVPDYEYDAANEFDMRLDFYGDEVSAETNQELGE